MILLRCSVEYGLIALSVYFDSQPSPGEIEERVMGFPSWFEVDLDRLGHNLDEIRGRAGVEVIPCVKANAYGHGLVPVVAYLMRRGVGRFLVAKMWEAVQLREAGLDCGIINMDPLFVEGQYEEVVSRGVIQTVYRRETAEGSGTAAT